MLTDKDKENVKDILKLLSEEELKILAMTVTQNMIMPLTQEEAVDAILLHSPSTESLLLRKKMSKEILFKYLHEKKVPSLSTSDKRTIVELILQFWKDGTRQMQVYKEIENTADRLQRSTRNDVGIREQGSSTSSWKYLELLITNWNHSKMFHSHLMHSRTK